MGNHKPQAQFIYSNCVCPENEKILNFPTYYDQVFDQSFDRSSMILISEDEKKKFETVLAHPDFQPTVSCKSRTMRKKQRLKEPLVLEKPEILPPLRKKPRLNYGVINDEGFNEDECLIQTDNPTNDIQNQTDEKPIEPIVEETKVVENKNLSKIPDEENIDSSTDVSKIGNNLEEDPLISDVMSIHEEKKQQLLCSICNKSYNDLPKHMKQFHTEIFKCKKCDYETPRKQFLKNHIESDHEVFKPSYNKNGEICFKPFKKKNDAICPICEYHSRDLKNVHVHIDSKHPEHDKKTFVCNHCPRSFIFEASLKKHLENQRTMAKNRAKKISLGLMQRNRRKKYDEH